MKKLSKLLLIFALCAVLLQSHSPTSAAVTASISPAVSAEGYDYATQVLKNAWDMNEYKDISKYLNTSGVSINLGNISVQNSIFSARTLTNDGYFFPLFPGYIGGYNPGGYGVNYPVLSSKFHCLSFRAKIDTWLPDELRVFWFADNRLTGGPFGVTTNSTVKVVPNQWAIYNYDLATNYDPTNSNTRWNSLSSWQGIRIDPSIHAGVNFAFDWVRLTDCSARNVTVSYASLANAGEVWMGRALNATETKLADVSAGSSSYGFRVEGWEAGDYSIGVKDKVTASIQWTQLKIAAAPRVEINKPSFTSGDGFTWQMNGPGDLDFGTDKTSCFGYSFSNGILNLTTNPPASIGGGCTASGYSDPKIFLKMPVASFNPVDYRYLSYRMSTEGAWQDINLGWVGRWLWYYNNGGLCIGVTYGISLDVDWEQVSLDMKNPAIGTPNYTEYCNPEPWSAHPISYLRFDPNENGTASPILQHMDWVSLNKMDAVQKGSLFTLVVNPHQAVNSLSLNFYYTPSLSQAPGTAMTIAQPPQGTIPPAGLKTYLPMLRTGGSSITPDGIKYYWDTSNVPLGTYYVCIASQDSAGNQSLDCSEAPVQVY